MSQYLFSTRARAVVEQVAGVYGYEADDLVSGKLGREASVVLARQVAMYALREGLCLSFPLIGKLFRQDHTTAIHGVRKIAACESARRVAERIIANQPAPPPQAPVTDIGLRQFLAELDAKIAQGKEIRRILAGESLEVAS